MLDGAKRRRAAWPEALAQPGSMAGAEEVVAKLRAAIANDLDTPAALDAVDEWAEADRGTDEDGAADLVRTALDSLLGVRA